MELIAHYKHSAVDGLTAQDLSGNGNDALLSTNPTDGTLLSGLGEITLPVDSALLSADRYGLGGNLVASAIPYTISLFTYTSSLSSTGVTNSKTPMPQIIFDHLDSGSLRPDEKFDQSLQYQLEIDTEITAGFIRFMPGYGSGQFLRSTLTTSDIHIIPFRFDEEASIEGRVYCYMDTDFRGTINSYRLRQLLPGFFYDANDDTPISRGIADFSPNVNYCHQIFTDFDSSGNITEIKFYDMPILWGKNTYLDDMTISEKFIFNDTETPRSKSLKIANTSGGDISFEIDINNNRFFHTSREVLSEALALPDEFDGESDPVKIFRYIIGNRYYQSHPATELHHWYNPSVYFNTAGFSICGLFATQFAVLASEAGYPTYKTSVNAHTVVECYYDDAWHMFDCSVGVYYESGDNILSIAGISTAPELFDDIDRPSGYISMAPNAYTETGMYDTHYQPSALSTHTGYWSAMGYDYPCKFTLPDGAEMYYGGRFLGTSIEDTDEGTITEYSTLKMVIPAGWSGTLNIPLFLYALEGSGSVTINSLVCDLTDSTDSNTETVIAAGTTSFPQAYDPILVIATGTTELTLIWLINQERYTLKQNNAIELLGENVSELAVSLSTLTTDETISTIPLDTDHPKYTSLNEGKVLYINGAATIDGQGTIDAPWSSGESIELRQIEHNDIIKCKGDCGDIDLSAHGGLEKITCKLSGTIDSFSTNGANTTTLIGNSNRSGFLRIGRR